jgi:hypothetical protein
MRSCSTKHAAVVARLPCASTAAAHGDKHVLPYTTVVTLNGAVTASIT